MASAVTWANFLSPRLDDEYGRLIAAIAADGPTERVEGIDPAGLAEGTVELGFLCGLPYVDLRERAGDGVEVLAAPPSDRSGQGPVYFSDLVVRAGGRTGELADFEGAAVAVNEVGSHSGHNALQAALAELGATDPFFSKIVTTGSHEASVDAVTNGEADVAAIDSLVLAAIAKQSPRTRERIEVATSVGPSPAPPLVAGVAADAALRARVREIAPRSGWILVSDVDYNPIRAMRAAARTRADLDSGQAISRDRSSSS